MINENNKVKYLETQHEDIKHVQDRVIRLEANLDTIRGSLFGGAVGDALGYAVEFLSEDQIKDTFGQSGITEYQLDPLSGKAPISDDTQMSLFTANGILIGETRGCLRGIQALPRSYVTYAYQDWLKTQNKTYEEYVAGGRKHHSSWLCDIPELHERRSPGITCLTALQDLKGDTFDDYIANKRNDSKGCGGIMRVAPLGLHYNIDFETLDMEAAQIAAITHTHPLGYMPAAILAHIVSRLTYYPDVPLIDVIKEAMDTATKLFETHDYINVLTYIINLAIELSQNKDSDLDNIHKLGEGWVAEETLAIALYCSLKYQNDFSKGIIASVNHNGDSDSTGAVTGNILGAICGFDAIEEKWKKNLELADIIIEVADDLCHGCQMSEYSDYMDDRWFSKYAKGEYPG